MCNNSNVDCYIGKVVKGVAIALFVAGMIRFAPDLVRYMKLRSM
jgi:hypothetical protein